jgi:hypothetical protein
MEAFSRKWTVVQPRRKIPFATARTPEGLSVDPGGGEGEHPRYHYPCDVVIFEGWRNFV